jgi:hypothetical protein
MSKSHKGCIVTERFVDQEIPTIGLVDIRLHVIACVVIAVDKPKSQVLARKLSW